MADYGLVVKNNTNEIQIDSKYRNLSVTQSGTSTISYNSSTLFTVIPITPSDRPPLFVFQPSSLYYSGVWGYRRTGVNFDGIYMLPDMTYSPTINWKVYRERSAPSSDVYGLRIFNPSNQLCFDSGYDYLKIREVHDITVGLWPATPQRVTISHPSVINPYYFFVSNSSAMAMHNINGFTTETYAYTGLKKISSTSVEAGWFAYRDYGYMGDPTMSNNGFTTTTRLVVCEI